METKSPAEKIWSLWVDVENWNKWDDSVEYSSINGKFENGTQGIIKNLKGPKSVFKLLDCVQNKSFTTRAKLPLCTMDFVHELIDENNGLKIRHSVKISGQLTFIFKNIVGKKGAKDLPNAVEKLSREK
ncbi:MAG: hypothetical protein LBT50_00020 [Prevotellaceae bacterium]|jgi:hypothetical protein|nr:hypothetical protein [Prevotellaceae bacterium]